MLLLLPPHACPWSLRSQRRSCKFSGPDCPFSHGVEVPLSGLLPDDGGGGGSSWLASLRSGSRVLAFYHDRVWYEATAEGPARPAAGAGAAASSMLLAVRFKGFEADGPVSVPADSSHLAPLEAVFTAPEIHGVGGGIGGSSDGGEHEEEEEEKEESDLEDAWAADAAAAGRGRERDGNMTAGAFFQERVLGDRRGPAGAIGGGGGGARGAAGSGDAGGGGGGLGSDAYMFGDWEQHTKGFGSRMMNRMGYRRGEGLGKEKQVRSAGRPHETHRVSCACKLAALCRVHRCRGCDISMLRVSLALPV